ncbi:hypothetical protein D3C85_1699290 [compost metagenome]
MIIVEEGVVGSDGIINFGEGLNAMISKDIKIPSKESLVNKLFGKMFQPHFSNTIQNSRKNSPLTA